MFNGILKSTEIQTKSKLKQTSKSLISFVVQDCINLRPRGTLDVGILFYYVSIDPSPYEGCNGNISSLTDTV